MTNTTNYNLLLAEGTDLVNYLTQTNPNFTSLDSIIKNVSDKTVTPATEVTVGTAHAITRSLTDCPIMRFTATSNWTTGDTITVDGNPVSAFKTDGTTLKTGDYIIGSEVIAILQTSRLTVFVSSAAPVNASDIVYDNTSSGLSAIDVQDAIDEIINNLSVKNTSVSSTYLNGDIDVKYNNHNVMLTLNGFSSNLSQGGYTTIGTLPSSVPRPRSLTSFLIQYSTYQCKLRVDVAGVIDIYVYTDSGDRGNINTTICYIC